MDSSKMIGDSLKVLNFYGLFLKLNRFICNYTKCHLLFGITQCYSCLLYIP
jgi:hypothetical protein